MRKPKSELRCRYYAANRERLLKASKEWRVRNPKAYEKQAVKTREGYYEGIRQRRNENKRHFIALLGGACVHCGNSDERVLQFDHLTPEDKTVSITAIMPTKDRERIEKEVRKCQLLCANCHVIKSLENGEIGRKRKYA